MANATENEKVTVFYHHPCLDGSAAAWAAHEKWGDNAQYIGINHGKPEAIRDLIMQNIDPDTHVVFADFTPPVNSKDNPPWKLMDDIAAASLKVDVYDHHASAIADMEGYKNPKVKLVFDETHSGAAITFKALFQRQKIPQAIELAEMIDLEQTHKNDFFTVAAYVDSLPLNNLTAACHTFKEINSLSREEITQRGQSIRAANGKSINNTMASVAWSKIQVLPDTDPVYVPIINANPQLLGREYSIRLRELAEKSAPGYVALSWYEDAGTVRVSVRTNGMPDAGKVAACIGSHGLGGGGHRDSAAAQFTIDQFNETFKRKTQKQVLEEMTSQDMEIEEPQAQQVGRKRASRGKAGGK